MKSVYRNYLIKSISKLFRKNVSDCLVCAVKPVILFGLGQIYFGLPVCRHVNNVKRPLLKGVTWATGIAMFFNFILLTDLYFGCKKLQENLKNEELAELIIKIGKAVNSLMFSTAALSSKSEFQVYMNYLIGLIENRKRYGIETILDRKTVLVYRVSAYSLIAIFCAYAIYYSWSIAFPKQFSFEAVVQFFSLLLIIYNYFNITLYLFTFLEIYLEIFKSVYKNVKKMLEEEMDKEEHKILSYAQVSLIDHIRYSRQLYLSVCRIYNKRLLRGNAIYFCEQSAMLIAIFVFCFQLYMIYAAGENSLIKVDLAIQTLGVLVSFLYSNIRAYYVEQSVSTIKNTVGMTVFVLNDQVYPNVQSS